MNIITNGEPDTIEIGKLAYGSIVSGVPSHPSVIYLKVDKCKLGADLSFKYPPQSSILLNLKTGGLRAVPGNTRVRVFEGDLSITQTTFFDPHLKDRNGF